MTSCYKRDETSFTPREYEKNSTTMYVLIYPHVTYGIEVWGTESKSIISRMKKITEKLCTMCREGSLLRTHFATFPKVTYLEISGIYY